MISPWILLTVRRYHKWPLRNDVKLPRVVDIKVLIDAEWKVSWQSSTCPNDLSVVLINLIIRLLIAKRSNERQDERCSCPLVFTFITFKRVQREPCAYGLDAQ